ncbi:GNAT family N-acetyltransferase [Candidatus Saccharibacteria bacterium]|nr:GNAT family N-acetyltransferase [Candidatus Saccharibacteria bacterium]
MEGKYEATVSSNGNSENTGWESVAAMAGKQAGENHEVASEVKVRLLDPEKDDLNRAANLIYQVDPYICPDFFGDAERAEKMGPLIFGEEGGLFDPNHTIVAEEDGKLLGILVYADNTIKPWDTEGMKEKVENLGIEMPEQFDRANKNYMEAVTEDARSLPDGVAEVEWCATDLSARGKGVASKMFEKFLSLPYQEQHLTVLADNPPAIHLYEKNGFGIVSSQTGYPDESVKTHNMVRKNK